MTAPELNLLVGLFVIAGTAAAQPKPAETRPVSPPTLRTAGAKTCQLEPVVDLGPDVSNGHAIIGFDTATGIAAWSAAKGTMAIGAIDLDGKRRASRLQKASIPRGHEPYAVYPLGGRFVIVTRLWDWQRQKVDWWGRLVDSQGIPITNEISLGLAGFDVDSLDHVDEQHLAIHAAPAMSTDTTHGERWTILEVSRDTLVTTVVAKAPTLPSPSSDAITYAISNGARPPGRGPRGTIYEALGRPMLERSRAGASIGEPLLMEHHGNPIAHSMNVSPDIAWSGTHFLYPFYDDNRQLLLPVRCKP